MASCWPCSWICDFLGQDGCLHNTVKLELLLKLNVLILHNTLVLDAVGIISMLYVYTHDTGKPEGVIFVCSSVKKI